MEQDIKKLQSDLQIYRQHRDGVPGNTGQANTRQANGCVDDNPGNQCYMTLHFKCYQIVIYLQRLFKRTTF